MPPPIDNSPLQPEDQPQPKRLTPEERERLLEELADDVEANLPPDYRPLSDEALRRENLYDDDDR